MVPPFVPLPTLELLVVTSTSGTHMVVVTPRKRASALIPGASTLSLPAALRCSWPSCHVLHLHHWQYLAWVQSAFLLGVVRHHTVWAEAGPPPLAPYARKVVENSDWLIFAKSIVPNDCTCCLNAASKSSHPRPPHLLASLTIIAW